jgi:hypothetical protein
MRRVMEKISLVNSYDEQNVALGFVGAGDVRAVEIAAPSHPSFGSELERGAILIVRKTSK